MYDNTSMSSALVRTNPPVALPLARTPGQSLARIAVLEVGGIEVDRLVGVHRQGQRSACLPLVVVCLDADFAAARRVIDDPGEALTRRVRRRREQWNRMFLRRSRAIPLLRHRPRSMRTARLPRRFARRAARLPDPINRDGLSRAWSIGWVSGPMGTAKKMRLSPCDSIGCLILRPQRPGRLSNVPSSVPRMDCVVVWRNV